jgi:hypothetical protein
MNPLDSSYQYGDPPRQAAIEIASERAGFKFSSASIAENGHDDRMTYVIVPDGRSHPSPDPNGDTVTATLKHDVLEARYSNHGHILGTEKLSLSPDQKRLTITISGQTATGKPYTNVAVYDRNK